jgi:nucleoside-diphosphate-sugar epimerase
MRTVVTGATGFIGGHLVRRLITRGDEVHAILRAGSDRSLLPKAVAVHAHDGSADQLCSILETVRPNVVFHLASHFQHGHLPSDIEALIADNVTFGSMLVEAMVRAGSKRLVNAGTSWQHYQDASYSPVCLYAATKQAFEAILRYYADAEALSVVTLKLFDTYGPGDRRGKLVSRLAKMVHDGSSLTMSPGEQLIDLVHVDDVVNAFLMAAARLLAGEVTGMEDYAVSSGRPRTPRDLVALMERCAGAPLKIEWGGHPYRFREVMVPWSKGAAVPGWSPQIELEEGFKMMLAENV